MCLLRDWGTEHIQANPSGGAGILPLGNALDCEVVRCTPIWSITVSMPALPVSARTVSDVFHDTRFLPCSVAP